MATHCYSKLCELLRECNRMLGRVVDPFEHIVVEAFAIGLCHQHGIDNDQVCLVRRRQQ